MFAVCSHYKHYMYEICTRQYSLADRQKSDFFIPAFEGAARRFFMETISTSMQFNLMCTTMEKEYNSDARKLQVNGILELFRLRSFMQDNYIQDVIEDLTKTVEHINEMSPECPREVY